MVPIISTPPKCRPVPVFTSPKRVFPNFYHALGDPILFYGDGNGEKFLFAFIQRSPVFGGKDLVPGSNRNLPQSGTAGKNVVVNM